MASNQNPSAENLPVFSVIIPVYNPGEWLRPCLNSVLSQNSLLPYEAILVDDGSSDGSGAVCDEYAEKSPIFRVLHTENQGVSLARNTGIEVARGEYLLFMDADDLWDSNILAGMEPFLTQKPDMVIFSLQRFWDAEKMAVTRPALLPYNGEEGLSYIHRSLAAGELPLSGSPCSNLYSHDFLNRHCLRFPGGQKYGEDFDFNMTCLTQAKSLYGVDRILYYYRQWSHSAVHTPSLEKQTMYCRIIEKWFRQYPSAPFAEYFTYYILPLSTLGSRTEVKKLTVYFQENRDILKYIKRPKFKLARWMFCLFGFYSGSALMQSFIHLRNRLRNIR